MFTKEREMFNVYIQVKSKLDYALIRYPHNWLTATLLEVCVKVI